MKNRGILLLAFILILTIGNYTRLTGNENIRLIQFLSIFLIGASTALLIKEFVHLLKQKNNK